MKKNRPKNNLDSLLEHVLKEDNPVPQLTNIQGFVAPETPKNASLDQAVDRYIVRYEKESIPTGESYENELFENYNDIIKEAFLKEADGIDLGAAADVTPDAPITPGPDPHASAREETKKELPILATPQINLQDFSRSIARLVNNFEQLLNPREIILNRVAEYIKVNYDEKTSKELMDMLNTNYSLRTLDQSEQDDNQWPTSYAAGSQSTES